MSKPQSINSYAWQLLAITFIAFLVRVYLIDAQPLSGDEAFTIITWTSSSPAELLSHIAQIDPQPPLALFSYYIWLKTIGSTEFAARLLSVLVSVITVPCTTTLAALLFNRRTALLTGILSALNPFQLQVAQDVRPYALWICLSTMSAIFSSRVYASNNISPRKWAQFTAISIASIFTFYLQGLVMVAQNYLALFNGLQRPLKWWLGWIASQLLVGGMLGAWLLAGGFQNSTYQPTATTPDLLPTLATLLIGNTNPYQAYLQPMLGILVLASAIMLWAKTRHFSVVFIATNIVVPFALLTTLTLATRQGFFRARYIGAISPYLVILIAATIQISIQRSTTRFIATIILATMLISSAITIINYHFNPQYAKAPPWQSLMAYLDHEASESDIIIQNYPDPAFSYYYQGSARTTIIPSSAHPEPITTGKQLKQAISNTDYVWFLPVPSQAWDDRQVVDMWMHENLQFISETWIGQFHLFRYAQWNPELTAIGKSTYIIFNNVARLDGYRITQQRTSYTAGDTITIELFITPLNQTSTDLTMFVHLIHSMQPTPPIAQDDHPPQHARLTTRTWTPNHLIRDVATITLPSNTPPGDYLVVLGFYDPTTNLRIPLTNQINQPEPDGALVTTITIATR